MECDNIVQTLKLTKRYGSEIVVDNLDLSIRSGEIFGFLGPNGAGKTTTLLMLLGLSEPTSGKVSVLGKDPFRYPLEVKSQVGYLAENMGVYGDLTARENLEYIAELNRMKNVHTSINDVLELVGLADCGPKKTGNFSRGMRQRLGLAEVLIKKPKLVFLDEPTLGLDPDGIATILELIKNLPRERGLTVILSSHLLYMVSKVADRVAIIKKGRLLAMGSVDELAGEAGLATDLEAIYHYHFKMSEDGQN